MFDTSYRYMFEKNAQHIFENIYYFSMFFIFYKVSAVIIRNVSLQFIVRPNGPQAKVAGLISKFEYRTN